MLIPLSVLRIVRITPRDESVRFNLQQVRFGGDSHGQYAVATDSKAIIVARWDGPETPEFGVSRRGINRFLDASNGLPESLEVSVEWRDDRWSLEMNAPLFMKGTVSGPAPEGKFPRWRVIEEQSSRPDPLLPAVPPTIGLLLMSSVAETLAAMMPEDDDDTSGCIQIWTTEIKHEGKVLTATVSRAIVLRAESKEWPNNLRMSATIMALMEDDREPKRQAS